MSLNNGQPQHPRINVTRWIAIVVTLLAIALMFRLGFWQLDRMHQKEARLASIAQKQTNGPISLFDLPASLSDSRDLPVTFNAQRFGNTIFYLDNQIVEGRVGYHVLAPVRTESGNVLLNFGWVPAGAYRDVLPHVELPVGQIKYSGILSVPGDNPVVRETALAFTGREVVLQKIDIDVLNAHTDLQLQPYIIQLEAPVDDKFVRNWQPVVMPPKKHLAYAVQWFGLALAASIIALIVFFPRGNRNDKNQSF
ncbi:SURF1 family protein [Salinimonas profundi]|uniref:SURF1 family protein n=1 Tax=Salinimonas profundi TaxID=2729140 RepID=UPI00295E261D|nr:SURF1 family protein [Salinimonas profundi]